MVCEFALACNGSSLADGVQSSRGPALDRAAALANARASGRAGDSMIPPPWHDLAP